MPGVPTLVTYIGYKNEPPVVFDGFCFSFGLRWRYGPMVPVVVNTKTKETIISTAGTCLMILWYYNSTLNIYVLQWRDGATVVMGLLYTGWEYMEKNWHCHF